ncbi:conserved hypothetical protein [Candida tropicalis MYA-3404]|uniref:Uncharacterized protein n=1 Tax=Candida tropicalis (strain ATCC MYA-3404 / T1) TaxID=294747 RepID=C5M919_CANTT|nr:conserved hypothetical protein [Candida tropicalis MYA-3404]EER34073.1 conserved hypothetical protein [Candida tropicalis MYA-3404]KAG4407934.1 hypothetical protein JTP64_003470 [Candida tropicalis]
MRLPKLPKKAESKKVAAPTTSIEFLEQGSVDEESGDRWLGSDLAKSLRFFDKAFVNYVKAAQLDSTLSDAYYNSARLLLHVYQIVKKVPHNHDVFTENGPLSVVQTIDQIISVYEEALNVCRQSGGISNDLLYNYAIVYLEWLELQSENENVDFGRLVEVYKMISEVFQKLLVQQTEDLQKFVQDLASIDSESGSINTNNSSNNINNNNNNNNETTQEELVSEEVIQPTDLFETLLSSYKLVQYMYENATSNSIIPSINTLVAPLLELNDQISQLLIEKFSEMTHVTDMVSNISMHDINELKLIKLTIVALTETDIMEVVELWRNDEEISADVPEKFMVASDNLQSLLDRNDINLETINGDSSEVNKENFWKILTFQNSLLKKAQELVNNKMQEQKKNNLQSEDLGSLIAQLSEIIIARADIELQRSTMKDYPPSVDNNEILFNNAKNLLRNAMNISNLNGGLRERMVEKIAREQAKLESVFRLCLLEDKKTVDDLDRIMTRKRWTEELPNLKKLGIYDNFGINDIKL